MYYLYAIQSHVQYICTCTFTCITCIFCFMVRTCNIHVHVHVYTCMHVLNMNVEAGFFPF